MAVSLEDWVAWVFDHSVKRPRMALEFRNKRWDHPTASTLQVITKLFESPALPLKRFSDAQLNQGFWFLCRNGGAMQGLVDERIPWEMRLCCIRSFVALFRQPLCGEMHSLPIPSGAARPGAHGSQPTQFRLLHVVGFRLLGTEAERWASPPNRRGISGRNGRDSNNQARSMLRKCVAWTGALAFELSS